MEFTEWTNEALRSLAGDQVVATEVRTYAGWELDYRLAFGISVQDPPAPPVDRSRYSLEATRARVIESMLKVNDGSEVTT